MCARESLRAKMVGKIDENMGNQHPILSIYAKISCVVALDFLGRARNKFGVSSAGKL